MIPDDIKERLEKQHYKLCGNHSAVQICGWTKKSLLDKDSCYKQKFYGIKSHKCCQMTPALNCQNRCTHCWRAIELNFPFQKKADSPIKIINECVIARKKLLSGFGGNKKINRKKFADAQIPGSFAISLFGEPTFYPKLAELIKELRKQKKISFLVTNGLLPEKILELKNKNLLPTQLYISLLYPDEKIFRKVTNNTEKNSWKKYNETLDIVKKLNTRTVIRLTLIKDLNMEKEMLLNYSELIRKASPLFIEIKSYMALGFSKKRLGHEKSPSHKEIRDYAKKLLKSLSEYSFINEQEDSKVVLLGKDKSRAKIQENEI